MNSVRAAPCTYERLTAISFSKTNKQSSNNNNYSNKHGAHSLRRGQPHTAQRGRRTGGAVAEGKRTRGCSVVQVSSTAANNSRQAEAVHLFSCIRRKPVGQPGGAPAGTPPSSDAPANSFAGAEEVALPSHAKPPLEDVVGVGMHVGFFRSISASFLFYLLQITFIL